MRRDVERYRPKVDLLVRVYAWHYEEQSGSLGPAGSQPTEPEHYGPLVLLNDLDGGAHGERHRDQDQEEGEHSEEHGADTGALGIGWKEEGKNLNTVTSRLKIPKNYPLRTAINPTPFSPTLIGQSHKVKI